MGKTPKKTQIMTLLESIGVDNPKDVLAKGYESIEVFGKSINKSLGIGKRAANTLANMQNRDPKEELLAMNITPQHIAQEFDSLTEFEASPPQFLCATSIAEQTLEMWDGSILEVANGEDICMTPTTYTAHVNQHATLIPAKRTFADLYKPYRGEDLNGKRLFIWRSGGIGDLLFIRPILMAFKEKYDVSIVFATRSKYHSMVEQWDDCIDELSAVPFIVEETLANCDYHITFEGLIERCKAAEEMDVYDLFARHSYINVKNWTRPMKFVCKSGAFDLMPKKYAVMQIASSSMTRTPYMGKMIKVANFLASRMPLVISGGPSEVENINHFISCMSDLAGMHKVINFARYTGSIVDAIKLVSRSQIVVAPDSSHVHMAGAQGVPCVGVYGPFPWACRATHYDNFIGVEPSDSQVCEFGGKHCFRHSYLPCSYNAKCWNNLDPNLIIGAIKELMKWQ